MARGPKHHLKRVNAPKHWMLGKMDGIWVSEDLCAFAFGLFVALIGASSPPRQAPRSSSGPHKMRESVPLIVLLRNRLKYALNKTESNAICMEKLIRKKILPSTLIRS